uniref:Uncharacterized protein n=1 Tax=Nelumbo nucifera TaxID=4432 RepID=A0A822Z2X1_NELNU|nr:TPA_asm: hypothetical protein HUJ06_007967 [Nelumbo nucifera]
MILHLRRTIPVLRPPPHDRCKNSGSYSATLRRSPSHVIDFCNGLKRSFSH